MRSALDQPGFFSLNSLSTGSNWYTLNGLPTAVGYNAAVSGRTGNSERSSLSAVFVGSNVSFRWKVSSEPTYDYFHVYIDGVDMDAISGEVDWIVKTLSFPFGSHTITWAYQKDVSWQKGEDRGYVDKVISH